MTSRPSPSVNVLKAAVPVRISYPFPLEDGSIATLYLPVTMTRADVERICDALRTLVIWPPQDAA